MAEPPYWNVRRIAVRDSPNEQFGYLELQPQSLEFKILIGQPALWGIDLIQVDDIHLKEEKNWMLTETWIHIKSQLNRIRSFLVSSPKEDPFGFVEFTRKRVAEVKEQHKTEQIEKTKSEKASFTQLDELDQALVSILTAFRTLPTLTYKRIIGIVDEQFQVTKDLIELRLSKLIGTGQISGHLDDKGYHRDSFLTFQCQVCETHLNNPMTYGQCPECKRFICDECAPSHTICPAHPETQTKILHMPLVCKSCQTPMKDLNQAQSGKCPSCNRKILP